MSDAFPKTFEQLTGHLPFPWQETLFHEWFNQGRVPESCNLPTGLGKTSVIAIWLIALAKGAQVPRRMVYVVNRRTVVDQTTNEVENLCKNLLKPELAELRASLGKCCAIPVEKDESPLAISTLRGQFADNREWSADPSRPAVICGTVDMIGSRLLFSGYGVGFKARPLHAGFLGQDALLVHDEAHLEPAFQTLIKTIECEQTCRERSIPVPWPKIRVMELTATTRNGVNNGSNESVEPFTLTEAERTPPDVIPDPPTEPLHHAWRRLKARKTICLHENKDEKKLAEEIADLAVKHRRDDNGQETNPAVLIFVRTLDDVKKVCDKLTDKKNGVQEDHVQQLTGTMRGLERDKLAESNPVFMRFLPPKSRNPNITPVDGTVYLVCTSAGEVGIDISADHLVCDLSTFESMAQRLGRVNRYGDRADTRIDVVHPSSFGKTDKKTGELRADEIDKRRQKTLDLLKKLPSLGDNLYNASPLALSELDANADERLAAFAPEPVIPPTTDILFDAWAMTSIREKMPGRPEVGSYLHGIADELPQTTIAWRAELDLLADASVPHDKRADPHKTLQAIFARHRIRPHETVTINSYRVVEFLEAITKKRPSLRDTRVALLSFGKLKLPTLGELIENPPLNTDPTLILPASFGYLDDKGMLSTDAIPPESKPGESPPSPALDIADHEGYELTPDCPNSRLRVLIERTDDGWKALPLPGGKPLPELIEPAYEKSTDLINALRKTGLQVRLVQPIAFNNEGETMKSLVALAPVRQQQQSEEQLLDEHISAVEKEAARLADALLRDNKIANAALRFAAKWHDEGKKAAIWQRYIGGKDSQMPLGKSAKWCDPRKLSGYRHEFGSLLRVVHPGQCSTVCILPDDSDVRDLALHLIAAHHGNARPHFSHTFDRDFTTQQSDQTHTDTIRRFARLQRKYGRWGLAYLESLLRAADIVASAGLETDDDTETLNGGDE
ncbi:MAG: type I-U CRISPR-associated helicase/endonuclease Cas3 [Phycisphaeraceae bacterium]